MGVPLLHQSAPGAACSCIHYAVSPPRALQPVVFTHATVNEGSLITGHAQTYVARSGMTRQVDPGHPHYCRPGSKYLDSWHAPKAASGMGNATNHHQISQSGHADDGGRTTAGYYNIGCEQFHLTDIVNVQMPDYIFIATFEQRKTRTIVPADPPHHACNTSSPTKKRQYVKYGNVNMVQCVTSTNRYVVNPEGAACVPLAR